MQFTQEKLERSNIKKVGNFKIFQDIPLGSGSYAKVYLSSDYNTNEVSVSDTFYAAKIINKKIIDPKKFSYFEEKVISEIKILKKLNHPNIVNLLEVRNTENNYYLIFEFCSGGTLDAYRNKKTGKRLIETEALEIIREIAIAMIYCNQKQPPIIHRDLKPSNILLKDGEIKICDFGLARLIQNCNEKLKLSDNIGSPAYMAPEVFRGDDYNNKCDVWSLGIILYQLLYGIIPWNSSLDTPEDLFHNQILKKPLKFNEKIEISEKTQDLIKHMLEINQDKRIGFIDVLNHKALQRKDKKIKETKEDSEFNNLKSINQNIELLNKNPLVGNCFIAKKKTLDLGALEIMEKKDINEENLIEVDEKDLEEEKTNETFGITGEILKKNDEIIKQAEDFVGFSINIVTFLRKVFNSFKSNEKILNSLGIDGKSLIKYMLLLKKMELIILYKTKKMLETSKINDFLTSEFYKIPHAKERILQDINEQYKDSLNNFQSILQETKDFPEKKVYFSENFEFNSSFNENYHREFEKLLAYLIDKKDFCNSKAWKLVMEILICKSFEDMFETFKCIKDRDNTNQFYLLYQDLKDAVKIKDFIEKKLRNKK